MTSGQQTGKKDTPIFTGVTLRNASDYKTTLQVPAGQVVAQNLILPATPGVSGQVIATDGAGNLSWVTPSQIGSYPQAYSRIFDEFVSSGIVTGDIGNLSWSMNASGGATGVSYANSTTSDFGIVALTTGTSATGYTNLNLGFTSVLCGNGQIIYEWLINLPVIASSTQDYWVSFGLGNNNTNADFTNGIYFLYDRTISASNWIIKTAQGGTRTQVTSTGLVSINTPQRFRMLYDDSSNTAGFYIDGVWVGQIGTNNPVSVGNVCGPVARIVSRVGSTPKLMNIDYFSLDRYFTVSR